VIAKERSFTKVAALFLAFWIIDLAGYALAAEETEVEEIVGEIVSLARVYRRFEASNCKNE